VESNDDKFVKIASDIDSLTKGKWSPKIDYSINDTEAVIQKILQNKNENGKYTVKKYNGMKIEYVEVNTEEEVRKSIIEWKEHLESNKGVIVSNFTDAFI
jgi:ubiquitin C-terminal hydrolase